MTSISQEQTTIVQEEAIGHILCPCGSNLTLEKCCGQYFDGTIPAPTPEALMRARYTAHVTSNLQFIIRSTHKDFRESEDEDTIKKWVDQVEWKGLHVLTSFGGGSHDTTGSIAFVVRFSINGQIREMKETAHFVKEHGYWYYTEGDVEGHITYKRDAPKIKRNDPCSCGSGKKYKKCCL
ncbi:MAG: YchJ family protein [Desulfovibrionaceae bacterium]